MTIDTACSSSLVAVHHAVRSLTTGECDTALVGGVNLLLSPLVTLGFQRAGALAGDGRCKAFDARADGFVQARNSIGPRDTPEVMERIAELETPVPRLAARRARQAVKRWR